VIWRVVLPLAAPGLLAGWALCFALAARELAATIIMRPPGYDTLAVRIWVHTMDVGPDPRAASVALLLLVVTALVWLAAMRLGARAAG
jgi:iron(III) transport system permease protein